VIRTWLNGSPVSRAASKVVGQDISIGCSYFADVRHRRGGRDGEAREIVFPVVARSVSDGCRASLKASNSVLRLWTFGD
jgi:hypothetical protein